MFAGRAPFLNLGLSLYRPGWVDAAGLELQFGTLGEIVEMEHDPGSTFTTHTFSGYQFTRAGAKVVGFVLSNGATSSAIISSGSLGGNAFVVPTTLAGLNANLAPANSRFFMAGLAENTPHDLVLNWSAAVDRARLWIGTMMPAGAGEISANSDFDNATPWPVALSNGSGLDALALTCLATRGSNAAPTNTGDFTTLASGDFGPLDATGIRYMIGGSRSTATTITHTYTASSSSLAKYMGQAHEVAA